MFVLGPCTGAQVLRNIGLNMTEKENFPTPVSSAGLIAIAAGRSNQDTPVCPIVTLRVSYAVGSVLAADQSGHPMSARVKQPTSASRVFMSLLPPRRMIG